LIFIPDIKPGESKEDYVSRCIAYCIKEEGLTQEQASGKCYGMWKEKQEANLALPTLDESKDAFMKRCKEEKITEIMTYPGITSLHAELTSILEQNTKLQALKDTEIRDACETEWKNRARDSQDPVKPDPNGDQGDGRIVQGDARQGKQLYCFICENIEPLLKTKIELNDSTANIQLTADNKNDFHATCVIGDRFYKGKYLSMTELQKSHKTLDGSYHDINHWGTTYLDGNPNVEYIVGYNDNVRLDPVTKAMTADIHIVETAKNYGTWRGFSDINKGARRIPNVSVSFYASKKNMKAKELGIDFAAQGYRADDEVEYLYDLEFQALSTVFKGACNDKDGCGIHKQDNCHKPKEMEDMKIIENKQEILKEKINRMKGRKE